MNFDIDFANGFLAKKATLLRWLSWSKKRRSI